MILQDLQCFMLVVVEVVEMELVALAETAAVEQEEMLLMV
tara:strand:- start:238 stop:357 length:120 start_codon:yes stop_codon:yes gene_type:complete